MSIKIELENLTIEDKSLITRKLKFEKNVPIIINFKIYLQYVHIL